MLNSCCMIHHPLEKMSWCEADLAGTWYRLWQIKCCWQNPLCSVAIPHNTKLEAPLRERSLLRLRSDYLNYSQWKQCTERSTVESRFLFLCVLMKAVIHLSLWNKLMLCMCWTAWTKHLYLLHLKSPSVLLVSGFVLSLAASLSLYIRAVYQQEAQGKVLQSWIVHVPV